MKNKIMLVPLDERPCNYVYPEYLSKIAGVEMINVPLELLGNCKIPSKIDEVWDWIIENIKTTTHIVLSMDMILYGGIVPSRMHNFSKEECEQRIEKVRELKKLNPELQIYAYQLITRCPARDGSSEEPDYYANYGYNIFKYGVLSDKKDLLQISSEEEVELEEITKIIPTEVLEDFIGRRKVNFNSNKYILNLKKQGVIDFLIYPMDDCNDFGFAPSERRELGKKIGEAGLLSEVFMYPGADDLGCILTGRAIANITKKKPKIFLDYSSEKGKTTRPTYEDRSICETMLYHVITSGSTTVNTIAEADFAFMINPPTPYSLRLEKEIVTDDLLIEPERNIPAFLQRIEDYSEKGKPCFIADCAIPNGSDRVLMHGLYEKKMLEVVKGYAGWNTSSNTIGTVLGNAVAYFCATNTSQLTDEERKNLEEINRKFLFFRYLEDWGYMKIVRKNICNTFEQNFPNQGVSYFDLKGNEKAIEADVQKQLEEFHKTFLSQFKYSFIATLPWIRMFEVSLHQIKSTTHLAE